MERKPLVGLPVVVHDRGRPQAGRDVHPATITQVVSEVDGVVSVRVYPENGVTYPLKDLNYMHGKGFIEGLSWRHLDDPTTVQTEDGEVHTPEPQDTNTPTPGVHEPRNVGGTAVAKPGEAPNEAVGETAETGGSGSEAAKAGDDPAAANADGKDADADKAGADANKASDDPFADLGGTSEADKAAADKKAADEKAEADKKAAADKAAKPK